MSAAYQIVDLSLANVLSKTPIDGTQGKLIYGVFLMISSPGTDPVPAGAQVSLAFGDNDFIILENAVRAFTFPCGHDRGVYVKNDVALAGQSVRLMLDFEGNGVSYAT